LIPARAKLPLRRTACMHQTEPLFPSPPIPLKVVDDLGPVGKGASNARFVYAENGEEYLVKGPSLTPDHPTVGANEWTAARLAARLGLPIQDHAIVEMRGDVFFATRQMPSPTFYPAIDKMIFERCDNRDRAYDVVVFDAWLINSDRHEENLVARRTARNSDRCQLMLNDHSHLLVSPCGPRVGSQLMAHLDGAPGDYVRLPFIRDAITDPTRLQRALAAVEGLSEPDIRGIVATTPNELLSEPDRAVYGDFLTARRSRLGGLFRQSAGVFPNLSAAL